MRPTDQIRLDGSASWRQRQAADRKGLHSEAARLELEEKRAHIDVAYLYHHEIDE